MVVSSSVWGKLPQMRPAAMAKVLRIARALVGPRHRNCGLLLHWPGLGKWAMGVHGPMIVLHVKARELGRWCKKSSQLRDGLIPHEVG